MELLNLSRPGELPVPGDKIRRVFSSTSFEDSFYVNELHNMHVNLSDHRVETIITEQERSDLKDFFNVLPANIAQQDHNLFNIEKREVGNIKNHVVEKICSYMKDRGYQTYTNYFVKYNLNSFTRLHKDDPTGQNVKAAVVTLVDTENLVGGDTLVLDKYEKSLEYDARPVKLDIIDKCVPYNQNIVPVVVKMDVGQSVIYDSRVEHGVTRVQQGHRIVLVSWFK